MRKTLTDKGVAALKPRPKRYAYPDPELAGHYVRITPSGAKSFAAVTRSPDGKQIWTTIGAADRMTIDDRARAWRARRSQRVRAGLPAVEAKGETFGDVAANWLKRHVERNGLRSRDEIVRLLERHILPAWRNREFISIRRSDIAALLDRMEDENGARQADYCPQHRALDHELARGAHRQLQPADRARHAAAVGRTRRHAAASSTTAKSVRSGRRPRTAAHSEPSCALLC